MPSRAQLNFFLLLLLLLFNFNFKKAEISRDFEIVMVNASPVWAALSNCLVQLVESMQKSALRIIFLDCSNESALVRCGLPTLLSRRDEACRRFISNIKESGFLSHLLPQPTNVAHGYGLRSGFSRSDFCFVA